MSHLIILSVNLFKIVSNSNLNVYYIIGKNCKVSKQIYFKEITDFLYKGKVFLLLVISIEVNENKDAILGFNISLRISDF